MPGLFQTIELGKRALLTHQLSLQTVGHNIANVNTPGFSRQRVTTVSCYPEYNANGMIGTGVMATDIRQVRDLFLGAQFRQSNKSLGQWTNKARTLSQIEAMFAEPGDTSLSSLLNDFWDSWSELSTDASSVSSRVAIVEQTSLLVNGFHNLADQLYRLQDALDSDIVGLTDGVNQIAKEIARLNHEIKRSELGSVNANDLRDARDSLVDELSRIIDVNTREDKNGELTVYIGAMTLVGGDNALAIEVTEVNDDGHLRHDLVWQGGSVSLKNLNGQLKGLLDSRDVTIPAYLGQLDRIAKHLIEEVNTLHRSGYGLDGRTGLDFFDPRFTRAATMEINGSIIDSPSRIAASASGEEGDNTIALAVAALREERFTGDGSMTINDLYDAMIGTLGIEAHEATSFADSYELLLQQIDNARQSVQGVSLDEEMANMVKHQHAYDAAARVITAVDAALDTVISGMGVVGR